MTPQTTERIPPTSYNLKAKTQGASAFRFITTSL